MKKLMLLPLIVIFIGGCAGSIIRGKVEDGIKAALPDYIGPAEEYTVDTQGKGLTIMKGTIEYLHIEGKDVQLSKSLTVSDLKIDMNEIHFNTKERSIKSVDSTQLEATITEESVNSFIKKSQEDDTEVKVKFEQGQVYVEVRPKVVGISVPVKVLGKPEITRPDRVDFVADAGSIAHLPIPLFVVNKALSRVNPIVDMSKMKFPVQLKSLEIGDKIITVKCTADLKDQKAK